MHQYRLQKNARFTRAVKCGYHTAEQARKTSMTAIESVQIRPLELSDLPQMYTLQSDPESNRMAVTIPRSPEVFDAHWQQALSETANSSRAILCDGIFVGYVSCFSLEGQDHVGYWVDRAYWGQGIASRALSLLLAEVTKRPIVATAATSNLASIRVLKKCGFVVEDVRFAPATDRYPACEEAYLVLQ